MAKNIVFCADGTWNDPTQDENHDNASDPTNVYKLFLQLDGALTADTLRNADEQEKILIKGNQVRQIAKYLHGVGDSRSPIIKIMGGAFGAGVISRVVRGYTFISRNYEPGDNIYIVGFSRGAYTARALAGLIASQGVLARQLTTDKEEAYRQGTKAWYRYRGATLARPSLAQLAEIARDLPAFVSQGTLRDRDLVPVPRIAAVGVWDTVGAMGLPLYLEHDKRTDAFAFVDLQLSPKVGKGFHAVALDEQRVDFTPSLWNKARNVVQELFPGAHADVGGGYPMTNQESGLSDLALEWMVNNLAGEGLQFATGVIRLNPSATTTAHKPWMHLPWNLPSFHKGPRSFPRGMSENPAIGTRMRARKVVAEPGEEAALYRPTNRPT